MDPVEALERIAYLLETSRAETYKVRAFRNATDVIRGIDPAELDRLAVRADCHRYRASATRPPRLSQRLCMGKSPLT